jgi:hypothetical protein
MTEQFPRTHFIKADLTPRSHEKVDRPPGNALSRLLISASGIPASLAYQHADAHERSDLAATGAALFASAALTAASATAGFHIALGDSTSYLACMGYGAGIGGITGLGDYLLQYKGTISAKGHAFLNRLGIKLPDAEAARTAPKYVRIGRVVQSGLFGSLTALFFMLVANDSAIRAYINQQFLAANSASAIAATQIVDDQIARAKRGLEIVDGNVTMLQTTRRSGGKRNDKTAARIEQNEKKFAAEDRTREGRAARVDELEANRFAAIEKLIMQAPGAIPKNDGLGGKTDAFFALSKDSPRLFGLSAIIEFLSLALECLPLWLSVTRLESPLAGRIVLDQFIAGTRLSQEGIRTLGVQPLEEVETDEGQQAESAAPEANAADPLSDLAPNADGEPDAPLENAPAEKRGRGRPRGSKNKPKPNGKPPPENDNGNGAPPHLVDGDSHGR